MINLEPIPYQIQKRLFEKMKVLGRSKNNSTNTSKSKDVQYGLTHAKMATRSTFLRMTSGQLNPVILQGGKLTEDGKIPGGYADIYGTRSYKTDGEFLDMIEAMLDKPQLRNIANAYLEPKLEGFRWSERVNKWFDGWKHIEDLKPMSDTESYKRILDFIHKKKSVSKKDILEHLNWGVRISFSEYRNRLRLEDTIKFTKDRYEVR